MGKANSASNKERKEKTQKRKSSKSKITKRSNKKPRTIQQLQHAEDDKKPQNHNALIASSANDTIDNIRVSLDMIREVACSDNDGMALSEDTKQGLFLHIENLMKALSFLRTL